ncbi:DUF6894 family protein [Bradyrhizobium japonicum]|jgi:hypothetical protein|uniref:DUF6894 family protein n=1 Tax=Bradyrhizobium japonicum TaxID=375 RepID=UPI0035A15396
MAVFYVDLHGSDGELRDDEGIELHDLTSARRLATEALGQIIIDNGFEDQYGLKSVRIRDAVKSYEFPPMLVSQQIKRCEPCSAAERWRTKHNVETRRAPCRNSRTRWSLAPRWEIGFMKCWWNT